MHSPSPRLVRTALTGLLLSMLAGCGQKAPGVYVLDSPQTITLTATASPTSVKRGESVVLRVTRQTTAQWKQIPRDALQPGQCWVYRPPPSAEAEVASDVQWRVDPENAVEFDRQYRMDHTRAATMRARGRIELTPVSRAACEPDRLIEGAPIQIDVR